VEIDMMMTWLSPLEPETPATSVLQVGKEESKQLADAGSSVQIVSIYCNTVRQKDTLSYLLPVLVKKEKKLVTIPAINRFLYGVYFHGKPVFLILKTEILFAKNF
jgi:transketolase